jgi:mannose/cellobiose epimerase-like protein (N-acyl-D-glucosamine 2-epimerase family)
MPRLPKQLFLLVFVIGETVLGQYVVTSPYLVNPENMLGYVDSCARIWANVYDPANGGFYTNVDRFGNPNTAWGTDKDLLTQTRNAYGLTRAYMLTGNDAYLDLARGALDFMYAHGWDPTHGGWYGELDRFGNPINPSGEKTAFDQHYALLGISASYEATRDTADLRWLLQGYAKNDAQLWDHRPQYAGYFHAVNSDWSMGSGKSFNATVDAITTHLLTLVLQDGDTVHRGRLLDLAENILGRLVPTMDLQTIGFVEMFDADWEWTDDPADNNTRTIMGHVLKAAWCLARIHQLLPDTSYVAGAEKLVGDVLLKGYDHQFGGPYKDYDRVTGEMFMYGQTDTAKAWWQMEQAVLAGLLLHDITGRSEYLRMADETLGFFMTHFVDHQYGDVYSDRTRSGGQMWGLEKGSHFKAGYHSIELGYYVYLYGKLILRREPITLHYRIESGGSQRELRMNPLALDSAQYAITAVRLDGAPYADFDGGRRLLRLPAGVGGRFEVAYGPVSLAPPTIVVNTTRIEFGDIPATVLQRDTTFYVTNIGGSDDSITVSLDPVNVSPEAAISVSPASFSLPAGASQGVTFRITPMLLPVNTVYNAVVMIDSRFGSGATHFERTMTFAVVPAATDVAAEENLPSDFVLLQNFPNPFNPSSTIRYGLPHRSRVELAVYNALGQRVSTLIEGGEEAGYHEVTFSGDGLASGVYVYRLVAEGTVVTRRMVLVR